MYILFVLFLFLYIYVCVFIQVYSLIHVFCLSCVFLYVFIHNNKLLYFVAPNQPLSQCLDISFYSEVKFAI
jgi:hypothetical protein